MLRLAICDDTASFLTDTEQLALGWKNRPQSMTVSLFEDADALIEAHEANPFDIIFLDVVMPLLNGIQAAGEIRRQDKAVKIVFLSVSPEFAVDSYTVKADNYLLKPVDPVRFYACLDECYADILEREKSITIKSTTGIHRVKLHTIEHIEAQGKLVLFTLTDGCMIEAVDPFYVYEDHLLPEDGFVKCHRSYLVNIYKISSFSAKEIIMPSGCRIPISRSCHKQFEAAYFSLLFGKADEL